MHGTYDIKSSSTAFFVVFVLTHALDSWAFLLPGNAGLQRRLKTPSKMVLAVDRSDLFRAGSAHPDSYLPGSPYQNKGNPIRARDAGSPKTAMPTSLSVDRSEVFRPVRPAESHITRTSQMRSSSSFPTSLEVDVPGHFQSGNAFVSGSLSRQDYSLKSAPRATQGRFGTDSFSVDRPEVFRPVRPHEKATQPIRSTTHSPVSTAMPTSFSVDHPDSYRPSRTFVNQPKSTNKINDKKRHANLPTSFEADTPGHFQTGSVFGRGSPVHSTALDKTPQSARRTTQKSVSRPLPTTLSVDHTDAFRPARPAANQSKPSNDRRRLARVPTSFEADTPGHFQTGSVFGRGSPVHSTAWNPNMNKDIRPPSSLSVDHPSAFTAASTRPTSSRPSRTSQQLGLAALDPIPSFQPDKPSAFNPDPNWKK